MKTTCLGAAMLLLAACGGGSAPPDDGPAPTMGPVSTVTVVTPRVGGGAPNVTALIGQREALSLTSPQINALDSIRGAWAEVDMRLRAQMREGAAGPAVMQMAENNAAAHTAIEQVLTPEQRRLTCRMPAARPGAPPAGPPPGRRGQSMRRRARGLPGESSPARHLAGGWPWCSSPTAG